MARYKYIFNKETLAYEEVKKPFSRQLKKFLSRFGIIFFIAIMVNAMLLLFIGLPEEFFYEKESRQLETKCYHLVDNMKQMEKLVTVLQNKDDHFYRPLFGLNPLPVSYREAGYGGVDPYADLLGNANSEPVIQTVEKIDLLSRKIDVQQRSFNEIHKLALRKKKLFTNIPAIPPVSGKSNYHISSYYGWRNDPITKIVGAHYGIDFAANYGEPVYATGNGKVNKTGYNNWGYGREIIIDHDFGYYTKYAHLRKILVKEGQEVKRGQLIGLMGSSGLSTGPHVHYEVLVNKHPVNPRLFYNDDLTIEEYEMIVRKANDSTVVK